MALDESLVKQDAELAELDAVEDILLVGYPIGLWDSTHNLPLIRRGITASHPAVDFEGKGVGVIDVACFPGSSGSPVMIVQESMVRDKRGNLAIDGKRIVFLGVLYAGPQMRATGEIEITPIPVNARPVAVTPVMINLGYYVKAKEVLNLGKHMMSCCQLNQGC